MTYPSVLNCVPILKLNLHNSFLKGLSLLQCRLSHFSVGADILLILHQAGLPAENKIGKGYASHCWKGWEMYYLNTIYFTVTLKIRFKIASERLEAYYCVSPLHVWGCLRLLIVLIVFFFNLFVLFYMYSFFVFRLFIFCLR